MSTTGADVSNAIGHNAGDKGGSNVLHHFMDSGHNNVKKAKPPVFQAPGAHIALSDYQKNISIM